MSIIPKGSADPRHQFQYGMGDTVAAAATLARIRALTRAAASRRATEPNTSRHAG
jgi:hypothetical protein